MWQVGSLQLRMAVRLLLPLLLDATTGESVSANTL